MLRKPEFLFDESIQHKFIEYISSEKELIFLSTFKTNLLPDVEFSHHL